MKQRLPNPMNHFATMNETLSWLLELVTLNNPVARHHPSFTLISKLKYLNLIRNLLKEKCYFNGIVFLIYHISIVSTVIFNCIFPFLCDKNQLN